MASPLSHRTLSLAVCAALFGTAVFAAPPTRVSANDLAFERAAKGVAKGQQLVVEGLLLETERGTSVLELERIEVWRADAVVLIDNRQVPVPKTVYFRGKLAGEPDSAVLLSVREKGGVMGMAFKGEAAWAIGKGKGQGALRSKKADRDALKKPFECALDDLPAAERQIEFEPAPTAESPSTVPDRPYDATIAIETDFEYYNKFSGATPEIKAANALDYMGDLIGYADLVYSREIDTDMFIGFSRLWTSSTDPWTATTSTNALYEFRDYWNANMQSTPRTVAHMLSGRETGGGVAWLSVLCAWYGSPGNNLSYGYSGTLDANFNWDGNQAHNPASVVWDIMVVQHEIGHNFSSPHTHDYCGYGGSSEPIDRCYQGCAGAATGLPTCTGDPITAYRSGSGAGTIMSYCHLLSGGYGNQAMTFGEGHPCGTLPGREANQMSAHVVSRNSTYPTCFVNSTCGNGAVDAGEECDGTNLNGATCASEGFVGGTISCSSSCTLNTSQCHNCGNNQINAGEVCDGTALGGASCNSQGCTGGTLSCNGTCTAFNQSACTGCPPCNQNGICDLASGQQETCVTCPSDCVGGTTSGAVCGNGLCEAGDGEDCASCPSDCRGVQGGKPNGRYCCGDGGGSNPVRCSDSRCTSGGYSCTESPSVPTEYCCGTGGGPDGCSGAENCGNCAVDCTASATEDLCSDGRDDNCDGQTDCNDTECDADPACLCEPPGSACSSSSECCSNICRTKGKNANTCA